MERGPVGATPLVENGFLYIIDGWAFLYKIDGTSGDAGRIIWRMDRWSVFCG